jgi:hypothetical protein
VWLERARRHVLVRPSPWEWSLWLTLDRGAVSHSPDQVLGRNLEALVDFARSKRDESGDECVLQRN